MREEELEITVNDYVLCVRNSMQILSDASPFVHMSIPFMLKTTMIEWCASCARSCFSKAFKLRSKVPE